jgi:hypothetical protein
MINFGLSGDLRFMISLLRTTLPSSNAGDARLKPFGVTVKKETLLGFPPKVLTIMAILASDSSVFSASSYILIFPRLIRIVSGITRARSLHKVLVRLAGRREVVIRSTFYQTCIYSASALSSILFPTRAAIFPASV